MKFSNDKEGKEIINKKTALKYATKGIPFYVHSEREGEGTMAKFKEKNGGGKVSYGHNHEHHHNGKCKHNHKYGAFDYHMGNPFEMKGNAFSKYG